MPGQGYALDRDVGVFRDCAGWGFAMTAAEQTLVDRDVQSWKKRICFIALGLPLIPIIWIVFSILNGHLPHETMIRLAPGFEETSAIEAIMNFLAAYSLFYLLMLIMWNWPFAVLFKIVEAALLELHSDRISINRKTAVALIILSIIYSFIYVFLARELTLEGRGGSVEAAIFSFFAGLSLYLGRKALTSTPEDKTDNSEGGPPRPDTMSWSDISLCEKLKRILRHPVLTLYLSICYSWCTQQYPLTHS